MKNLSLLLNAVLITAVAFLFYKEYYGNESAGSPAENNGDSTAAPVVVPLSSATLASLPKGVAFAFVNIDTLYTHYGFAKDTRKRNEGKANEFKRKYDQKKTELQNDYNNYMENAKKGVYSRDEEEAIGRKLTAQQADLAAMEMDQGKILNEMDISTAAVQKKTYDYLKRFNSENGYFCAFVFSVSGDEGAMGVSDSLDVTWQVLEGLNAEYKANKGK